MESRAQAWERRFWRRLEVCPEENEQRAVKRIWATGSKFKVQYERELKALLEFSKPKYKDSAVFVEFFGWFEDTESVYLAMEYVPLGDLEENILTLGGTIKETEIRDITVQILEGLEIMHQENFAHRDLKPKNVLVCQNSPRWWVKLADFGLSKRQTEDTAYRTQMGTQVYMAPEILSYVPTIKSGTSEYTNAVDIWALGCIVYRLASGVVPFPPGLSLVTFCADQSSFPSQQLALSELGSKWVNLEPSNINTKHRVSQNAASSFRQYNTATHAGLQSYVATPLDPVMNIGFGEHDLPKAHYHSPTVKYDDEQSNIAFDFKRDEDLGHKEKLLAVQISRAPPRPDRQDVPSDVENPESIQESSLSNLKLWMSSRAHVSREQAAEEAVMKDFLTAVPRSIKQEIVPPPNAQHAYPPSRRGNQNQHLVINEPDNKFPISNVESKSESRRHNENERKWRNKNSSDFGSNSGSRIEPSLPWYQHSPQSQLRFVYPDDAPPHSYCQPSPRDRIESPIHSSARHKEVEYIPQWTRLMAAMLLGSEPSLLQKMYDECYLIFSTASTIEERSSKREALQSWRSAMDQISYYIGYREAAGYVPKSKSEKALTDKLHYLEILCKERVDSLEGLRRAGQEKTVSSSKNPSFGRRNDLEKRPANRRNTFYADGKGFIESGLSRNLDDCVEEDINIIEPPTSLAYASKQPSLSANASKPPTKSESSRRLKTTRSLVQPRRLITEAKDASAAEILESQENVARSVWAEDLSPSLVNILMREIKSSIGDRLGKLPLPVDDINNSDSSGSLAPSNSRSCDATRRSSERTADLYDNHSHITTLQVV